jgi:HEAT repeat protein
MSELVAALQATSAAERWQAIAKLNRFRSKLANADIVSALIKALADEHPFVRWQAGLALIQQDQGDQKLAETLKTSSPEAPLSKLNLMRSAAIDALGLLKAPIDYTPLIEILRAGDPLLRQSAAEALANKKASEAVPYLIEAMKDPDPWVRRAAAYALGHLGSHKAVQALIFGLQDRAVIVRRSAAYALGALRAQVALPHLKISLTDKDPVTRRNAAWALGRLGSREAVPELMRLLGDPDLDGSVMLAARQAIELITKPRWLQLLLGVRNRFQR